MTDDICVWLLQHLSFATQRVLASARSSQIVNQRELVFEYNSSERL